MSTDYHTRSGKCLSSTSLMGLLRRLQGGTSLRRSQKNPTSLRTVLPPAIESPEIKSWKPHLNLSTLFYLLSYFGFWADCATVLRVMPGSARDWIQASSQVHAQPDALFEAPTAIFRLEMAAPRPSCGRPQHTHHWAGKWLTVARNSSVKVKGYGNVKHSLTPSPPWLFPAHGSWATSGMQSKHPTMKHKITYNPPQPQHPASKAPFRVL